ncbi:hypothetical protein [Methanosarcina siciliae]|nr:hypothetical protein [Methanosarcina siciliae]
MTTIIKKILNGNPYFYAVKSGRVNGKPRIVSQVYLGTADNIVEMKKQCESLPYIKIKVALAHPAASNGVCSRHRSKFR